MAFEYKIFDYSMASTPASIPQFSAVVFDTVGNVKLPAGASAGKVAGITQEVVNTALQSVPVRYLGITKAIVSAATAVGDLLGTADTTGKVVTLAAPIAGQDTVGRGLEAGTASGDVIAVLVNVISR